MRVLLDECVPRPLRREIVGHEVRTIREMGWTGQKNGKLLALMAAAGFDALLTVDQNLRYQQDISESPIAVLVVVAASNRLQDLIRLVPKIQRALARIQPGAVMEIQ